MPFEISNAPASFQQMMNQVFVDKLNCFIPIYLEDILAYSRLIEEH